MPRRIGRAEGRGDTVGEQDPGEQADPAAAGRVTLGEVAARAGVSRAAASLALRGKPGVGDETRRRVVQVAEDLGYRGRVVPGGDVRGSIGLLVKAKLAEIGSTNAFYASVIAGVSGACADAGLDLRLDSLAVDEDLRPIEVPRMLRSGDADGLIILGAFVSTPVSALLDGRPVVLVDGYAEDASCLSNVVSDNAGGTAQATRHLIGLGHRRIAMVGSHPASFPSILDRRRGYAEAMAGAGLEPRYVDAPHDDPERCVDLVRLRMSDPDRPTALVAANDAVALRLSSRLELDVPGEVSVVGFDDIEASSLVRPALTTVRIDKEAMGRMAVSLLRHRIAHPEDPAFTQVQRGRLVVRGSTAPPRGA